MKDLWNIYRRPLEGLSVTSEKSLDDLHDLVDEVRDIAERCPGGLREISKGRRRCLDGHPTTSQTSSMRSGRSSDEIQYLDGEIQSIKTTLKPVECMLSSRDPRQRQGRRLALSIFMVASKVALSAMSLEEFLDVYRRHPVAAEMIKSVQ
ncbi:hypothetical protein GCM10027191_18690 [Novilysobacter erysipheiresistens]